MNYGYVRKGSVASIYKCNHQQMMASTLQKPIWGGDGGKRNRSVPLHLGRTGILQRGRGVYAGRTLNNGGVRRQHRAHYRQVTLCRACILYVGVTAGRNGIDSAFLVVAHVLLRISLFIVEFSSVICSSSVFFILRHSLYFSVTLFRFFESLCL